MHSFINHLSWKRDFTASGVNVGYTFALGRRKKHLSVATALEKFSEHTKPSVSSIEVSNIVGLYSFSGFPLKARMILSATNMPCIEAALPILGPGASITSPRAKMFGERQFFNWSVLSTRMAPVGDIEDGERTLMTFERGLCPVHFT